ncbi:MAG: hypothetical protein AB1556_08215 [Bacillota bacterium]
MSEIHAAQVSSLEKGKLTEFQVAEPAALFGNLTPPVSFPVAPAFVDLATVSVFVDDTTDRVWLNATVGWFASFTAIGTLEATFQLLRETVVIYETRQAVSSPPSIPAPPAVVNNIVHLEHNDNTPIIIPATVTYTLRVQASAAGAVTSGPITLTAAEIEKNVVG